MNTLWRSGIMLAVLGIAGCGSGTSESGDGSPPGGNPPPAGNPAVYQPAPGATWQWQLQGALNTSYDVAIYDVDLFETPRATIDSLHAAGRKVICYFSAGSYENWRADKSEFTTGDYGNQVDSWPGEYWVDIRSTNVRRIMLARLDLAQGNGCDGVEPDNVEGYGADSGFPLTAAEQLDYNRFIAAAAHARGLAVALKNDLDQIPALVGDFDFAVNEECFQYDECDALAPFIAAGKAVLRAEYDAKYTGSASERNALCADAAKRRFSTLVLPLELDDRFRYACP